MKKFVKQGVLCLVLAATFPGFQVFAQETDARKAKISIVYKALTESKDVKKTIVDLLKSKTVDPDTIASVAAAANISLDVVEAAFKLGNPSEATSTIVAAYDKGLSDIGAYSPSTGAGPNSQNQGAQSADGTNGGFSGGSPASSISGGGGGSASHN